MDLDVIWKQLDTLKNDSLDKSNDNIQTKCIQCEQSAFEIIANDKVCTNCGLVSEQSVSFVNESFEPEIQRRYNNKLDKLSKMQEWYMWSNEEKSNYKLQMYIQDVCSQLCIPEMYIQRVYETVIVVLNAVKKFEGTKRAKIKDSIILLCIEMVSKSFSAIQLGKKMNIEARFISKAEQTIIELVNSKKLDLKTVDIHGVKTPIDSIRDGLQKRNINIDSRLIYKVKCLINICDTHDLLIDHSPLSIGVGCLYYILQKYNINIDARVIADIYNLSHVTVLKTFNQLTPFKDIISKHLN